MDANLLTVQFQEKSVQIAESFDRLHGTDLQEISEVCSLSLFLLKRHLSDQHSRDDPLESMCGRLLFNTLLSCTAALDLLRRGYRLQPGILIRNVIETLAAVAHLRLKPRDLEPFTKGELKSHATVTTAKRLIPSFGWLYGFFTKEFAHLGTLHTQPQSFGLYEADEDALEGNLNFVRRAVWLHYVTTEFVFVDLLKSPRYWRRIDPGHVAFGGSEEELKWASRFLRTTVLPPKKSS